LAEVEGVGGYKEFIDTLNAAIAKYAAMRPRHHKGGKGGPGQEGEDGREIKITFLWQCARVYVILLNTALLFRESRIYIARRPYYRR
jgi:hypothetical protein